MYLGKFSMKKVWQLPDLNYKKYFLFVKKWMLLLLGQIMSYDNFIVSKLNQM